MNNFTPHTIAEQFTERKGNDLSLSEQAALLGISHASLYYRLQPVDPQTLTLMHRIDEIHTEWPSFGQRIIAPMLSDEFGIMVGRKRVGRLMRNMGIEAVYPKPNLSLNGTEHPVFPYLLTGVNIVRPNQVWGTDITYIRLKGGFLYLVVFMDWYSRYILSWRVSTSLETDFVLAAAREALLKGIPEIANSDQGVQYTDRRYKEIWDLEKTKLSMDHRGRCFDNIFTERFWRSLKYDEVYLKDYETIRDAEQGIGKYIRTYNEIRPHSSLNKKTPASFYYAN